MIRGPLLDYVIEVPDGGHSALPWAARAGDAPWSVPVGGKKRQVGPTPSVSLEPFEAKPGVLRTRIHLTANDPEAAAYKDVSFVVDRDFTDMLKPHDTIYVRQDFDGAVGISVMRQVLLVAAAGSVSCVPLGDSITIQYPGELAARAEAIYRERDPRYRPGQIPIEVITPTEDRLLHWGRVDFGRYEVFVVRPFEDHTCCVAVTCLGVCPDCAATLTAPVINAPDSFRCVPFKTVQEVAAEGAARVLFLVESARRHFERGDLDAAHDEVMKALLFDFNDEAARRLAEEIKRRR